MAKASAPEVIEELLELEQQRCRAISEHRWDDLESLLAEDLTHTHTTGKTEHKDAYLEGVKAGGSRTLERRGLEVRLYGETAVMTGRQIIIRNEDNGEQSSSDFQVLQVWVERDGKWQLVAFQASGVRT